VDTARDKLIAEWQERLAAAEAADIPSLSRPAWLARLQIRLYRFLLSLYGRGDWTTTTQNSPPASDSEVASDSVVFDSPSALPLAGKPAKSLGQIQAVLKSVANAQSAAPAAGPLVHGLTPEHWVTIAVASTRHAHKAFYAVEALHRRGIAVRHYAQGLRHVVEVRAGDFEEAIPIVRQPPPPPPPAQVRVVAERSEPGPLAHLLPYAILLGIALGVLGGYFAAACVVLLQPDNASSLSTNEALTRLAFFGGWFLGGVFFVGCFYLVDLTLAALRNGQRARRDSRGSLATFFTGLAWKCFAAGVLIGPFVGLFAVFVAGRSAAGNEAIVFLGGWIITVLAGGALFLDRET
jgi:hypothetical protein